MAKILKAKEHDIGGLNVKRVLPHQEKRMVGPFIFFDQMGPNNFPAGQGINVRPHPHIGLSTLTYLFAGSILHRDSLGNNLEIQPGDVNWMTAGKGIVHSERESFEVRANPHEISGLQCWVALPQAMAELEPAFSHTKKTDLPHITHEGVMMRLVVGEAYGLSSPVKTYSPMFYIDVVASKGSVITRPNPDQEMAIFTICGEVTINGETFGANEFILIEPNDSEIELATDGRFVMLGGEQFEQVPFISWNFVSFSKERIKQAEDDWKNGRFPTIPGDDKEFIPLK
ncbi:pirin family protein [Rheinheimera sp. MMS21-TC3]|uniref:pirin family protein n=1 Tax=Rheinheimera sp. MMS21-TC3 TaxID=3072790 RepID=UPI0028C43084|nr:pirin family protein [Rheinheimera sp. MMS21-TC3]WNO62097.1 pirin family protein [Rheinheimera sp. MMS21-TC3]